MKKNYLEDIRPITRVGRTTSPKNTVKSVDQEKTVSLDRDHEDVFSKHEPIRNKESFPEKSLSLLWNWKKIGSFVVLGLVLAFGFVYGLSFLFRGAIVTITPKHISGGVDLSLVAKQDDSNGIQYELMTLSDALTKEVTSNNSQTVSMKASGSVVLYNFQTTSQSLVATTRFADPSGQVFRLPNGVTIPKKTVVGGKETPGQITVTLVADVAGTKGNIPLSDFTIVAFKGTAKEKLVYGRGKTPFSGGTSGPVYVLDDATYKQTQQELVDTLNQKLKEEVLKQVPEGYVLLSDSLVFIPDTNANSNTPSQTTTVTVTYGGTQRGILIKKESLDMVLLDAIARGESISLDQVSLRKTEDLVYQISSDVKGDIVPETISFSVKGDVSAVWNIDQEAIRSLLVGSKRVVFNGRMQTVPAVADAELVIRPFWRNSIPDDISKIKISIKDPVLD